VDLQNRKVGKDEGKGEIDVKSCFKTNFAIHFNVYLARLPWRFGRTERGGGGGGNIVVGSPNAGAAVNVVGVEIEEPGESEQADQTMLRFNNQH